MYEKRAFIRVRSNKIKIRVLKKLISVVDLSATGALLNCKALTKKGPSQCEIIVDQYKLTTGFAELHQRNNKTVITFPNMPYRDRVSLQDQLKSLYLNAA